MISEDLSIDAENTDLITGINNSLQYIYIENCYFQLIQLFHNIKIFTVFFDQSNEQKRLLLKTWRILQT